MTRKILLLFVLTLNMAIAQNLKIGGYVQFDDRVRIKDKTLSWEEYRLDLTGQVEFEKVNFYSEVWFRNFGSTNVKKLFELSDKNKVAPIDVDIREAYVDFKGFIFDNLDLRIGRQRIAWGTADKLNPTDNLNPDDLEDIWDYGRHLGSNAIKLSYYLGSFTFTGVFIPEFVPAVLPRGDLMLLFADDFYSNFSGEIDFGSIGDRVIVKKPDATLKDGSKFGFKIAKRDLFGFDVSLSYVYGRDDIPIVKKIYFQSYLLNPATPDSVILEFPRMRVLGFDLTGEVAGVGVWAEAGIFYPEKVDMEVFYNGGYMQPGVFGRINVLDKKSYMRFVLGLDYTTSYGMYLNLQYLHGFLHERGRGNLKNYFTFNFEKRYMNDKVKFNFLSGGVEFKRLKGDYAIIYNPQLSFTPVDNFEFSVGGRFIESRGKTTFGKLKDRDEVYVKVKYSF
jgi:hypothetical protein